MTSMFKRTRHRRSSERRWKGLKWIKNNNKDRQGKKHLSLSYSVVFVIVATVGLYSLCAFSARLQSRLFIQRFPGASPVCFATPEIHGGVFPQCCAATGVINSADCHSLIGLGSTDTGGAEVAVVVKVEDADEEDET